MNLRSYSFFLAVFFALSFCSVSRAQWVQTSGPYGGQVSAVTVLGTDVFVATPAGIYHSTDSGSTWAVASSDPLVASVSTLVTLGSDLFAVNASGSIVRSIDQGMTWTEPDPSFDEYPFVFSAQGPDLFIGSGIGGVFRSSDRGLSWSIVPSLGDTSVNAFTSIGSECFAATSSAGVFLSSDRGATWSVAPDVGLPAEMPYNDILSIAALGTELFVATDSGIFLSSDSGATWTFNNPNFLPVANVLTVVDSILFMGSYYSGDVYFSTDRGNSWTSGLTVNSTIEESTSIAGFRNNIFSTTYSNGIYRSTDGGAIWAADNAGIVTSDVTSLAALGNALFSTTSLGELDVSSDDGDSWNDVTSSLSTAGISTVAVSDGAVYAASTNSILSISNDTGMTWGSTGFLGPLQFISLFGAQSNIFAGTTSGLFESTDQGSTWVDVSSGIQAADIDITSFATDGSTYYCGGASGGIYTSSTGTEWTNTSPPGSFDTLAALTIERGDVFAGSSTGLLRSNDRGETWNTIGSGTEDVTCFLPIANALFAGTTSGIIVTTDEGNTWADVSTGLSTPVVSTLAVNGPDLYAGTTGGGVWRRPIAQMVTLDGVETGAAPTVEQNYPNPFNCLTTIPFTLASPEHVTIAIFNMLGEKIVSLADGNFGSGSHTIAWNTERVTPGNYYCRISDSEGTRMELLTREQ